MRTALAFALLVMLPAVASAETCWERRMASAWRYANARDGRVAIAVIDGAGRQYARNGRASFRTASLLKTLLLASYLRQPAVRRRSLSARERALVGPMIRRSDDAAASAVLVGVGGDAIGRAARAARQRDFRLVTPIWGLSKTSAVDQVRLFRNLDRAVPARHRAYAHLLLHSVVRRQRWGLPRARPIGWTLEFKGGWGSGTGRVNSQAGNLRRGGITVTIAVMTESNPSHDYGSETIRGVAARLLRPQPCAS